MKLTAKELSRILQQPGYGIAAGSLIDPLAAPSGPGDVLQADGASRSQTDVRGRQRAPSAGRWRNEREFQRAVFEHIEAMTHRYPELALAYHPANENSHRQPGVRGGVPDIVIPISKTQDGVTFGSCFIELKLHDGKLSRKQQEWIQAARRVGNFVAVVYGDLDEVLQVIEGYLGAEQCQ